MFIHAQECTRPQPPEIAPAKTTDALLFAKSMQAYSLSCSDLWHIGLYGLFSFWNPLHFSQKQAVLSHLYPFNGSFLPLPTPKVKKPAKIILAHLGFLRGQESTLLSPPTKCSLGASICPSSQVEFHLSGLSALYCHLFCYISYSY